ncbi:MAG TPA: DUF4010 domain-containing protein [Gemmatimonadales bacterium]|nr:DUF4010 domain-containing protein [Gemmatimonadales bacterium]
MALTLDLKVAADLSVAVLAGLAVGVEREWSGHATGPGARFAGARTFLLLGLLGGIAGWLTRGDVIVLGAMIFAGSALLVVTAYAMAARRGPADVEGTTEVAAIAVLALGAAAGLGFPLLTSAAASVLVLMLVEKTRIHRLIARIGEREMAAALQFAVLALVILPLLPEGPYGPFASVRPRSLWTIVLLLSGLNFAGYLARLAVGATRGYGITGLLGGLVSSTAVTLSFAHRSREEVRLGSALASGVVLACTVVFARVLLVGGVLNAAMGAAAARYLLPALVIGAGFVTNTLLRRHVDTGDVSNEARSPLSLWSAVKMAFGFQLVLLAVPFVQQTWGAAGVLTSAVIVGIADMDALTVSMAQVAHSPESVTIAAQAIAVGALASTVFKLGTALVVGVGSFRRRVAAGLTALAGATAFGIWLAR